MTATPLDATGAWELLLAAREAGPPALAEAGLAVEASGAWSAERPVAPEAAALLDLYLGFALADAERPMTVGHLGQSLDGRIATAVGESHYVTGPENLLHLHRMRALADAVVVGIGTALADDPQLTVRRTAGPDPRRVVIDPRGRLPAGRRLLAEGASPLLIVAEGVEPPAGAEAVALPAGADGIAPGAIVAALRARDLSTLFVEGGGDTVTRFLAAGALDRLQVAVAPLLIGGGRPGIALPEIGSLAEAPRPPCRRVTMGEDVLFDCDLRAATPAGRDGRS